MAPVSAHVRDPETTRSKNCQMAITDQGPEEAIVAVKLCSYLGSAAGNANIHIPEPSNFVGSDGATLRIGYKVEGIIYALICRYHGSRYGQIAVSWCDTERQ
jgi:hypothetical protein